MTPQSSSQSSKAPRNAARWRRGAVPSSTAAPYNGDDQRGSMQPAIRSVQPCAILAALAGALVLAAITGLRLDAVPALPAKIILGVSLPVLYGAMLGAIRPRSRPGPAARRPGPRPNYGNGTPVADDDLRHPSEAETPKRLAEDAPRRARRSRGRRARPCRRRLQRPRADSAPRAGVSARHRPPDPLARLASNLVAPTRRVSA